VTTSDSAFHHQQLDVVWSIISRQEPQSLTQVESAVAVWFKLTVAVTEMSVNWKLDSLRWFLQRHSPSPHFCHVGIQLAVLIKHTWTHGRGESCKTSWTVVCVYDWLLWQWLPWQCLLFVKLLPSWPFVIKNVWAMHTGCFPLKSI